MSVSNKTNYNENKKYWKQTKKNRQLPHVFNIVCHNFLTRYCSKSLRKNSSKLCFVTIFLQVYKYFFCSKTNRRSLRWVEIGICNGRKSSNLFSKICLFERCTFSFWYSLNHLKVLEKNSFDSWQYKKVCSIESGLRQKGHLSSEANLYFSSSFFVVIILCTTLKVNCLSLLSFEDLYIFTKQSP